MEDAQPDHIPADTPGDQPPPSENAQPENVNSDGPSSMQEAISASLESDGAAEAQEQDAGQGGNLDGQGQEEGQPPQIPNEISEKAAQWDAIQSQMTQHGVTEQDMDSALGFIVAMRQNPVAALAQLAPIVEQLQQVTGQVLPPDLHEQVLQGILPEQTARELSQLRAQQHIQQVQQQQFAQQQRQVAMEREVQSASAWDAQMRASDPGFDARLPLTQALAQQQVNAMHASGQIIHPGGLVEILKAADAQVKSMVAPAAPAKPATRPVPNPTRTAPTRNEPSSFADAISMGLEG